MKVLLAFIAIISFSSPGLATTHVDAKMTFAKNTNGKKIYGTQWFPQHNVAIVTVGLLWKNFDPAADAHGFDLSKAATAKIDRPQIYDGCEVKITGQLFPSADGAQVNTVSINFQGAACKSTIDSFAYVTPTHLTFSAIPTADGQGPVVDQLTLEVEGLPLTACGAEGSVNGRAADCADINSTLNTRTSDDGNHRWSLITYDEVAGPAWKDETTATVWSPEMTGEFPQEEALSECSGQPFFKTLPTKDDAEGAIKDGYFGIILNGLEVQRGTTTYWTASDGVDPQGQPGGVAYTALGSKVSSKQTPTRVRCTTK